MPGRGEEGGRLTIRAIEAFLAVAQHGAIAGAAQQLEASPSTVSQQVTNLEAALGVRLVDRAARPFALTPAGRLFRRRARVVVDELTKARAELAEHRYVDLPELRLAIIEDFDAEVTPAVALTLARLLPDCHLACRTGPSHSNLEALTARAVDMAVATENDLLPGGMEQHPLLRDPFVLVAAKGLLGAQAEPLDVLRQAPMTGYAAPQLMQRQIAAQFRRLRFDARPRFEFDMNDAVMAMVAHTGGWTVTTPLGFLRTPRFHDALEMRPLPFSGFARTLSLHAREGSLGELPGRVAAILRETIERETIRPATAIAPWLKDGMRLLHGEQTDLQAPAAATEPTAPS
ncbi:MAG: LysR family transcriptional regulator [Pseudomonadota bacterium]